MSDTDRGDTRDDLDDAPGARRAGGFRRRYGGSPLSLLVLLATFALGGYAAWFLLGDRVVGVVVWFAIGLLGHDLLLLPLYALADRAVVEVDTRTRVRVPWINYVRFPAVISGVLLLIFLPSIGAFSTDTVNTLTTLTTTGYLATWLLVTGVLFLLSAVCYAVAVNRAARRGKPAP
ncbi:hypothetical protein ACXR2U_17555 [Jatrophihabitans sp. YIM 134969]